MRVHNNIGENGKAIIEYIPENEEELEEIYAMMVDGIIPTPPPETKNWIRLCAALDGFFIRYNRWPSRVRAHGGSLWELREVTFTPDDYAKINTKVTLIEQGNSMIAEDDSGGSYDYGAEGFPDHQPSPTAAEWLGVEPKH